MKFDQVYPDIASIRTAYPDKLMGPHPEIRILFGIVRGLNQWAVTQSWRVFPCLLCRAPTSWRVDLEGCPGSPYCSEECYDAMLPESVELRALEASVPGSGKTITCLVPVTVESSRVQTPAEHHPERISEGLAIEGSTEGLLVSGTVVSADEYTNLIMLLAEKDSPEVA